MDLGTKTANDLISKDFNTARAAAEKVVNYKDIETFEKLVEKSPYIFDFLKEKMVNSLLATVNQGNYKNLFAFMDIYSSDFEDFVVLGLVKFASEELTDEILDIFENGTLQQKTYCASYFSHIKDPLCLEMLNKYALDEFEPLSANCARALFGFEDKTLYNKMLEVLKGDAGDFEKLDALNFLVAYGDEDAFDSIAKFMQKSAFSQNIAASILSLKPFSKILEGNQEELAIEIFDALLSGYPEILPLATLNDFGIFEIIKHLVKSPRNSYINRVILKAKAKFTLCAQNDIYTFDLDKNTKNLILDIEKYLNTVENNDLISTLNEEILKSGQRAIEAFDMIQEFKVLDFASDVAELIKSESTEPQVICEGVKTLKVLEKLELIKKEDVTKNVTDENILALINSYF